MVQINDVVGEVLGLVQDDLRVEAVLATAEYHENLPEIHAAHTQIQQAILNLVRNRFYPEKPPPFAATTV